jgi:Zn-finger nucleic acid-binding protein
VYRLPALPCPRCKEQLIELEIRAGVASGCNRCRGVWLDDAAYAEVRAQSWTRIVEKASRKPLAERDESRQLICPICRKNMQKTELAYVTVDFCPGHGTWFDPGEVESVAHEIAGREAEGGPAGRDPTQVPSARRWIENAERMNASLQLLVDGVVAKEAARAADRSEDDG